jgi:hypothetical protein
MLETNVLLPNDWERSRNSLMPRLWSWPFGLGFRVPEVLAGQGQSYQSPKAKDLRPLFGSFPRIFCFSISHDLHKKK